MGVPPLTGHQCLSIVGFQSAKGVVSLPKSPSPRGPVSRRQPGRRVGGQSLFGDPRVAVDLDCL